MNMLARCTCTLMLMAALAPAARAVDDAGTASMFAVGAGNRALALGGAYAAVADDASGWMWNPAGLGWVSRAEFQLTQSSVEAIELDESFAGVVVPNWRWGAGLLTYRQFSVQGIEGRDARNFVTDESLRSAESEFAIGYGRSFGGAWGFGAVAKARRQEVAGRSGNAVGADLGVMLLPMVLAGADVAWARDLTLGVSLRNVLEPAVRLDLDEVPDPRAMRMGLGWRQPLFGGGTMLAALDIERREGSGGRVHAGVELSPHPVMQLRAGLADGRLTAGTGFAYRQFRLDYAFENSPLEESHRVGLSMGFGRTVEQGRQAALREREEEIESRLGEAFDRRQAERVAALLAEARSLHAAGEPEAALEKLATLRALEPGHVAGRLLEADVLRAQGEAREREGDLAAALVLYRRALESAPGDSASAIAARRCLASSEAKSVRTEDLRRRYARALDAFGTGDLPAARRGFQELMVLEPLDEEIGAMLARTERAIAERLGQLAGQSERLARSGLFAEAEQALQEARRLDPQSPLVTRATAALAKARAASPPVAAAGRAGAGAAGRDSAVRVAALTPEQRRQVDDLYRRGLVAFEQGRTDQGVGYFELVWDMAPGHREVATRLKREYLARGLESFAAGALTEAVGHWQRALRVDPADAKTRAYLAKAQEHLARSREIGGR